MQHFACCLKTSIRFFPCSRQGLSIKINKNNSGIQSRNLHKIQPQVLLEVKKLSRKGNFVYDHQSTSRNIPTPQEWTV